MITFSASAAPQVEEGLCGGAVLYHAHINRSKAEVSAQQAAKDEAAQVKAARRRQQEENVRRKEVRVGSELVLRLCLVVLVVSCVSRRKTCGTRR
jgi:hypothetical protein